MSSSRRRSLRLFASLRARLLVGQVALLAGVCVGIAGVTLLALHQYLVGELDEQLMHIAQRSAMMERRPPPPPPWHGVPMPQSGPGPDFPDAPGQPVGMVAAVVADGSAPETPVAADTHWEMGSETKLFTGLLLATMAPTGADGKAMASMVLQ